MGLGTSLKRMKRIVMSRVVIKRLMNMMCLRLKWRRERWRRGRERRRGSFDFLGCLGFDFEEGESGFFSRDFEAMGILYSLEDQ